MSANDQSATEVRFGRTILVATEGELARQPAEVLVVPANARGVMGTGQTGGVRLAGGVDIEREAMAQAPLPVGGVVVTGSGQLAERGVQAIIHGVVTTVLGEPARIEIVRRVVPAAFRVVEERRFHTVALPLLGSGTGPDQLSTTLVATAIVEEVVAHLRRVSSRIERVTLVSRSAEDVTILDNVLRVAREHAWGLPK